MNSDRSSFSGAAIGRSPPRIDQDEDELDEPEEPDPEEPDFDPDFEEEEPDFEEEEPDFDDEDFDAPELADEVDFDPDVVDDDPEEDDPSFPVTCRTSFFAPSSTVSPTSPARAIAKSFAVCTPSCTAGWFQTFSAALRSCS
ncbi:hypothetical protein [Agromyces sp. SYSU T0242]|uniref:hypothetical protein n=1 Tax=Agromyces litoreus TaxID=3158561 RepID=UPI003395E7BF